MNHRTSTNVREAKAKFRGLRIVTREAAVYIKLIRLPNMRTILSWAAIAGMVVFAWSAHGAVATNTPKKKPASSARRGPAKISGKKAAVKRTTWRNRQLAPTPERYKEIQDALMAKGYLKPEDAGGSWNQASVEALKKFQSEQNLESSGKINSLSLIALGLGPKHDIAPGLTKPEPQPVESRPLEHQPADHQPVRPVEHRPVEHLLLPQ